MNPTMGIVRGCQWNITSCKKNVNQANYHHFWVHTIFQITDKHHHFPGEAMTAAGFTAVISAPQRPAMGLQRGWATGCASTCPIGRWADR